MFTAIIRNQFFNATLTNLNVLNIGYRVIYAEYTEGDQTKIRAYGRKEFDEVEIQENGNTVAVYPLKGDLFRKQDFNFVKPEPVQDEEAQPIEEPTEEPTAEQADEPVQF